MKERKYFCFTTTNASTKRNNKTEEKEDIKMQKANVLLLKQYCTNLTTKK